MYIYIKFHENPSSFFSIRMDRRRQTDMTTLIVAFRKFERAKKKVCICILYNSNNKCPNISIVLYSTFNNKQQSVRESAQIARHPL